MPTVENRLYVEFTKDEVHEALRQAALERLAPRFPDVRREDLKVSMYVQEIPGAPSFAWVMAELYSDASS